MRCLSVISLATVCLLSSACATSGAPHRAADGTLNLDPTPESAPVQVFYNDPGVLYKSVCAISEQQSNALGQQYTKKSDFVAAFKRRARRCGANAVLIKDVFAFERGTAFATGTALILTTANGR
jgi:hypothetical protein